MEIDSTVLYKPSEEQHSSAFKEFEEFHEDKPYEASVTFSAEVEKAFSFASLSPPSEGEGPQTLMDKFFNSLTASETKDQISEQKTPAQESVDTPHSIIPEDVEDHEILEVSEEILTETEETPTELQQPIDDAEETITIRMRRKRKNGMSDTSLLSELNQLTSEDPDKMFLLSMMPAMKRVRLDKVDEVRLKILEVIKKNRCPSTISSSMEAVPLLSRNLSLEERSVSKADGEPVVPNAESLMNSLSLSVEFESEPSAQNENTE